MPALYTECNNPDINQDVFIPKPRDPTYIEEHHRLGARDPKDRDIGVLATTKQGTKGHWDWGRWHPRGLGAYGPWDCGSSDLSSKLVQAKATSKLRNRHLTIDVEPELHI